MNRMRFANRCGQLIGFFQKLGEMYHAVTGGTLHDLCRTEEGIQDGNIIAEAVRAMRRTSLYGDDAGTVDPERSWDQMTLADMEAFSKCLKYSLKDEFLLVHYDDTVMWGNTELKDVEDIWSAYHGLLQECRSAVINLSTLDYALLPFAKFRNLNECTEYSEAAVRDRMESAETIEFSEKLDGSFMQMRYLEDDRFQDGILVSSAGTLDPEKSRQLAAVLRFMKTDDGLAKELITEREKPIAEKIRKMVTADPSVTFIFEWISDDDPHVVSYGPKMQGLHLVGMRGVEDGRQYSYQEVIRRAAEYDVPVTSVYSMTLDEALVSLKDAKGTEQEGYVLNVDGFLVKIKCLDFLNLLHYVEVSRSFNTIVRYAAEGKADDFIAALPVGYQRGVREKLRKLMMYEQDVRKHVDQEYAKIPADVDKRTAMKIIDEIGNKLIRGLVRSKYLGQPLEIIARNKGNSVQYVREPEIDRYYQEVSAEKG